LGCAGHLYLDSTGWPADSRAPQLGELRHLQH
jgi:hypothetical protein